MASLLKLDEDIVINMDKVVMVEGCIEDGEFAVILRLDSELWNTAQSDEYRITNRSILLTGNMAIRLMRYCQNFE